jgi:hypothetical protein
VTVLERATRFARWGAVLGLACGVLYAFGGMVIDLLTVGLNGGTALAFLALVGMPALFGAAAFAAGGLAGVLVKLLGGARKESGPSS